jgi:hypothetical protein
VTAKRWCIRDRHYEWCATADGKKPDENAGSVGTACGEYVIFPHGIEWRVPTCKTCKAPALLSAKGGETP